MPPQRPRVPILAGVFAAGFAFGVVATLARTSVYSFSIDAKRVQHVFPWLIPLWGFLVYAIGTWWGIAYVLGTVLASVFFVWDELDLIRKCGDVPGLEAGKGEGVMLGLLISLFWPLLLLMAIVVGLRKGLAALGRRLARLDQ